MCTENKQFWGGKGNNNNEGNRRRKKQKKNTNISVFPYKWVCLNSKSIRIYDSLQVETLYT
jgi:hypothetical protein